MSITTEKTFETAIVDHLTNFGGWLEGSDKIYDKALAFFPAYVLSFIQDTQPKQWDKLAKTHGNVVETKVLQRLSKELELRGTLDVLRNGFTDYGVTFRMSYPRPESSLNPETIAL